VVQQAKSVAFIVHLITAKSA